MQSLEESLHQQLDIVDGLIFYSDGDATPLQEGHVAAANVTVSHFQADLEQTVDQLAQWHAHLAEPSCGWHLVRTTDDIAVARREGKVGLIMGWQNARPVADKLERLRLFHDLGVRVIQLTYNERNYLGDGCLEPQDGGLSRIGQKAVLVMNALGIAIDLSHCSEQVVMDTARLSSKPVLLTHANASAVSAQPRNKSDKALEAVVRTGGVIGLSIHGFMCWSGDPSTPPRLSDFLEHLDHVAALVGYDAISVGTDFCSVRDERVVDDILNMSATRYTGATGAFTQAFGNSLRKRYPSEVDTPAKLSRLTEALVRHGLSEGQIRGIMGENLIRCFRAAWGERVKQPCGLR